MNGYWITTRQTPQKSAYYYFAKQFSLEKLPESFSVNICADRRYILYINGVEIAHGPCQSGEEMRYFETVNAAHALKKGENEIAVRVFHVVGDSFIAVYGKEKPALWFCGKLRSGDEETLLFSDSSWQCKRSDAISFRRGERIHNSVAPFEDVAKDEILTDEEIIEDYEPRPERASTTCYGLNEKYILTPRPIPVFTSDKSEKLKEIRRYTDKDGKTCVEFDAGRYTTSFVDVVFKAKTEAEIKITYAECYAFPDGENKPKKFRRDDTSGCLFGAYDSVISDGNKKTFTPFWYRAFRFIKIETDDAGIDVEIFHRRYVYPFEKAAENGGVGSFLCSDETLNKMWDVSLNTVECSTHEIFVDCPYYEQQQYCMDGVLESLFAFRMSNDRSMQKKIIFDMAQSQQMDGMIQANYPSTHRQIIPGFTLFWVLMSREYLRYTGDTEFVRSMSGVVDRALEGFEAMLNERGIVGGSKYWMFTDWVDGWKLGVPTGGIEREPVTVYSMMYAAALESQAQVCEKCGRRGLAEEYRERKSRIIQNINKYCFDAEKQMYVDVPGRRDFSRHTAVWAVLSDTVTGDDARELIIRAFGDESVSKCSFSMNYYTFRALEKVGLYDDYSDELFDGWRYMLDMHCTTWCENPGQPRSECHGWSSVPIYEFSEHILGVYPEDDGYKVVRITPHTFGLENAQGRVPMPGGYIDVSFKKHGDGYILHISSSERRTLHIILPGGDEISTDESEISLEFTE